MVRKISIYFILLALLAILLNTGFSLKGRFKLSQINWFGSKPTEIVFTRLQFYEESQRISMGLIPDNPRLFETLEKYYQENTILVGDELSIYLEKVFLHSGLKKEKNINSFSQVILSPSFLKQEFSVFGYNPFIYSGFESEEISFQEEQPVFMVFIKPSNPSERIFVIEKEMIIYFIPESKL